jgi:hypothetical protein
VLSRRHRLAAVVSLPGTEVLECGATVIGAENAGGGSTWVRTLSEDSTTQYPDQSELVPRHYRPSADAQVSLNGDAGRADLPTRRLPLLPPADVTAIATASKRFEPHWLIPHQDTNFDSEQWAVPKATRMAPRVTSGSADPARLWWAPSAKAWRL